MTDLTDAKIHLAMLALRILRLRGDLPESAALSPELMARIAKDHGIQLDERTIRSAVADSLQLAGAQLARLAAAALP